MAIKSALRPESIVRRNPINLQSAQNFISGGAPLGSSVVSSAANKIVGFQRAAVKPVTPDINSIVSTISSNILNQVDNSIRNATNITNRQVDGKLQQLASNTINQIQQIRQQQNSQVTQLQTVVQNIRQQASNFTKQLSDNYQKRLRDVDAAKPVGILDKFLDAYKNALGFVNFFGSGKNIKQLRESLDTLKTSFTESFEIAKLIRQTILKIVNQLSNLPQASPGGSPGLNLDIDVPGGPLRRTAPKSAGIGRKGAGLLGLGLGAVAGGMAVNALADSDRLQSMPQISNIPTGLVDAFAFIVNKFANAVDEMIKGSSAKTGQGPSTSSPGGGAPSPSPASTPSAPGGSMSTVTSAPGDEKLAAFVSSMEASSPENAADALQVMLNRAATTDKYKGGLAGVLSGYDQFSPISAAIFGKSADPAAARKYGPIASKLPGKTPEEKFKYLQQVAAQPDGLNKLQQIFGGGSAGVAATILNDPKYLEASRKNVKGALNFGAGSIAKPGDVQVRQGGNYFYNFTGKIGTIQKVSPDKGMGGLGVDPSKFAPEERAKLTMSISQPPPSQAKPSIVTLPGISGGQPQQASGGGGQVIIPPTNPLGDKGPSIPILPSSDSANFLTMYSKIVYNIVDG
jgi:uncharacterized protein (UPF0147 family)